jgi:LPXTG-site transpeptidase (sortase) family protein
LIKETKFFFQIGYERKIKYIVTDIFKVFPKETSSLSQRTNGKKEITLITCTADSKERIIVKGVEEV